MQPSPPQEPPDPLLGSVLAGRYRILAPLGEGGMGRVYAAEHITIEKRVAIKVLRPEYAHKGDIVSRFQQEAISASRIKHPNVLDVFDFGRTDDGCFYLAMEYLEGNDLADEIQRRRFLDPQTGVRIALQICRALSAAHAKGVVHRDMKPENVFLQQTQDGEQNIKIVDFGIAQLRTNEEAAAASKHRRLTKTGMIFGTPEYMAPEQAAGKRADPRADIYAVAIMLYEMFTGAVPFTGETFLGVLAKHLHELPPPMTAVAPDLAISPQLQAVIFQGLAKNPDERYPTMLDFSKAIQATPEGCLVLREGLGLSAQASNGGFVVPAAGNPTAPEFGEVSGPPARAPGAALRGSLTIPRGSGEPPLRSETPLASAASGRPGSRVGIGWAAGAVLTLLAASGAWWALRASPGPSSPASAERPLEPSIPPALPVPAAAPRPVEGIGATPRPAEAPASVRLQVETLPEGATLTKDGFQVCDATPCEVVASVGESLQLEALKGALRGRAKVLAQRDQRVRIQLAASPRPTATKKSTAGAARLCEVEVDGLKILRACP